MIDTLQLLEELKERTGYTLPTRVIGVLGELLTREVTKIEEKHQAEILELRSSDQETGSTES